MNLFLFFVSIFYFLQMRHVDSNANTNLGYSLMTNQFGIERNFTPMPGTINWKLLEKSREMFSPRHSHATCVFRCPYLSSNSTQKCIWLTGGATKPYRTWDLKMQDRTADVWYSKDGSNWIKVKNLTGDFLDGIGNFDAKVGGDVAPWYSRFGHSLDALDLDGDGQDDIMVLIGGYEPMISNDIWITEDGFHWRFAGYAPWPERAYHATFQLNGDLFIAGGTPLMNDIWRGVFTRDASKRSGYRMVWINEVRDGTAPWAPRCAMCIISQTRREDLTIESNETVSIDTTHFFLIGGFAQWPRDDPRWNGGRTRNDVWTSTDGKNWTLVLPPSGQRTMPFVGRGWHSCITMHEEGSPSRGIRQAPHDPSSNHLPPKMIIAGGAYTGEKGNNVVYNLEGYTDMYWSYDGSHWTKVNYEEGKRESLWSSNEWTQVQIDKKLVHRGKWGHTMEMLLTKEDLNMNGIIDTGKVPIQFCTGTESTPERCAKFESDEEKVHSLFVIGGDTTDDGGPYVNDVFVSQPGLLCEQNGETCSSRGRCGLGNVGCICSSIEFIGEYCQRNDEQFTSNAVRIYGTVPWMMILSMMFLWVDYY